MWSSVYCPHDCSLNVEWRIELVLIVLVVSVLLRSFLSCQRCTEVETPQEKTRLLDTGLSIIVPALGIKRWQTSTVISRKDANGELVRPHVLPSSSFLKFFIDCVQQICSVLDYVR